MTSAQQTDRMPSKPTARLAKNELADLNAFRVVERLRSFTLAAAEMAVTPSALSHAVRNLEARLGVRLLNRTSRTVSPTAAGVALAQRLEVGFQEISSALAEVNRHRDSPVGKLRINVLDDGARLLLAKFLPRFMAQCPDISVEVAIDDRMVDIVKEGFDAGFRFGGTIPEDLVAVPIGPPLRWVATAAPKYLNRTTKIVEPEDLKHHNCIQIRTGQGVLYRWDFQRGDEHRAIEVPGQLCVTETTFGIEMALAGCGITYCLENRVAPYLERGELQVVLDDWAPIEPPFHIYYPGRRQMPPGLRELIDVLKDGAQEH